MRRSQVDKPALPGYCWVLWPNKSACRCVARCSLLQGPPEHPPLTLLAAVTRLHLFRYNCGADDEYHLETGLPLPDGIVTMYNVKIGMRVQARLLPCACFSFCVF